MTDQLRTLLHEAADDHPYLAPGGDPWRRGRRIRLGRRAAGLAGVAVTAAAVVAGTVLLTMPDPTSAPDPAEQDPIDPSLPATLFEVPPNIPDIGDDPLGEPAALVYSSNVRPGLFSDEAARPLVVGAESDQVRAVREAPSGRAPVLSPDGTMLAATDGWQWTDENIEPDPDPPGVFVVNLITGESATHVLPDDGFGGGVDRLTWTPDSSVLATTVIVATEEGDVGQEVYGSLNISTGEWRLDSTGDTAAISPDGQRALVDERDGSGYVVGSRVGNTQPEVEVDVDGRYGVAFSPDGGRIAAGAQRGDGITTSEPHSLEIFDTDTGEAVGRIELGDYYYVNLLGWGERGVLVESYRVEEEAGDAGTVITVVERIDVSDPGDPARSTVIVDQSHSGRIGIPAAFLDAETRETEPPDAGFDWAAWVPDPYLLIILGGVIAALLIGHLRRRARSGRGSTTVRGSNDR